MRPRSKSKQSESHLHYHYHYYYPVHERQALPLTDLQKLSSSFVYEKDHYDEKQETPKLKPTERLRTEGDSTTANPSSKKKMRMSEVWRVKQEFPSYQSAQRYELSDIKARSVVEEEIQQFQEETEDLNDHDGLQLKSRGTDAETYSHQSRLIAYYQSQLQNQKKQIERLKMVQEECQYLRDQFYGHFTSDCHNI